jgi:hypothetical protein
MKRYACQELNEDMEIGFTAVMYSAVIIYVRDTFFLTRERKYIFNNKNKYKKIV